MARARSFFRFLRLAVVAGAVYWWLFAYVHRWLFDAWLGRLTDDLAVERTEFYWRALMYVIFATLLALVNVAVDYAKVRAVVEDRRSMLGALFASIGFIARRPGRVFGLVDDALARRGGGAVSINRTFHEFLLMNMFSA